MPQSKCFRNIVVSAALLLPLTFAPATAFADNATPQEVTEVEQDSPISHDPIQEGEQESPETELSEETAQENPTSTEEQAEAKTEAPIASKAPVASDKQDQAINLGIVSDVHIAPNKTKEKERFEEALNFFTENNVDRIVVDGDFTDHGNEDELEAYSGVIEKVQGEAPIIESIGNHELINGDYETIQKYTKDYPLTHQKVNGYHIITVSPGAGINSEADLSKVSESDIPLKDDYVSAAKPSLKNQDSYTYSRIWLDKQLEAAAKDTPNLPIFVFFHHPMKDTFYVSDEWYGYGLSGAFDKYKNVVAFSGHIHSANQHPRSIYQDEKGWTAVNTVTLSYLEQEKGYQEGSVPNNAGQVGQAIVLNAVGGKVIIKTYDIGSDGKPGKPIQTWAFDVNGDRPYTNARYDKALPPSFAPDAKLTVDNITPTGATFTFDQAQPDPDSVEGDIVHSYKYVFTDAQGKKIEEFKTWSDFYINPQPDPYVYQYDHFKPATSYTVTITPIDAFGKENVSSKLTASFVTPDRPRVLPTEQDVENGLPKADLVDTSFTKDGLIDKNGRNYTNEDGVPVADIDSKPDAKIPAKIVYDEKINAYVAVFTESDSEGYKTEFTESEFAKAKDGFTISTTARVDSVSDWADIFGATEAAGFIFEIGKSSDTSAYLEFWAHDGSRYVISKAPNALKYGEWNNITGVYDGKYLRLYLNGQEFAKKPMNSDVLITPKGARAWVIGGDINSNGSISAQFNGAVKSAKIFSRPLSPAQVAILYANEMGLDPLTLKPLPKDDPSEPEDPANPTDPTEPSEPENPVDPADPSDEEAPSNANGQDNPSIYPEYTNYNIGNSNTVQAEYTGFYTDRLSYDNPQLILNDKNLVIVLLQAPYKNAKVLGFIESGEWVKLIEIYPELGYALVEYQGKYGYVSLDVLQLAVY